MPPSTEQHAIQADDFAESHGWRAKVQSAQDQSRISSEPMPSELIAAMALVKRACAKTHREFDRAHPDMAQAMSMASARVIAGQRDQDFPMSVWHMEQPTAQIFTTALHVAASVGIAHNLVPALEGLRAELLAKAALCQREGQASTAQETAANLAQLGRACDAIERVLPGVHRLNMHERGSPEFGEQVAQALTKALELPFVSTPDEMDCLQTSLDTLLALHGALKSTALSLMKISSDMGQRAALANSPTTPCDALTMVCCQVMGNDVSLTIGAATGQFEGRSFQPLIAHNLLQSIRLLTDATTVFTEYFVRSAPMNRERISHGLADSLMLVTARVTQV